MSRRPSYTDRRRARLARRIDRLEVMESRNMVTEALSSLSLGIGIPAAIALTRPQTASASGTTKADRPKVSAADRAPAVLPFSVSPAATAPSGSGAGQATTQVIAVPKSPAGDWLSLGQSKAAAPPAPLKTVADARSKPDQPGGGGGVAGSSHGATVGTGGATIAPFQVPAPAPSQSQDSGPAPVLTGSAPAPSPQAATGAAASIGASNGITATGTTTGTGTGTGGSTTHRLFAPTPPENVALGQFTNFPVYTLDQNDGVVLFPGYEQLATLNAPVDLRAQVSGTAVSSYSWNTTGLTDATGITGSSTYRLQFSWKSTVATAKADTATLTVTGTGGAQEVQTYTFWVPAGTYTGTTTPPTWPESYPSNLQPLGTPLFARDNTQRVSADSNTGGVSAILPMPSYSPNIPGLVLSYDSLTAAPQPIVVEHHALDPTKTLPTQVSAQLTFNGTAGTTFYYNSSALALGDVMQIAPAAPGTAPATGRYGYSLAIGDVRGTTTTTTVTGTATVINNSASALGDGWSVGEMEQLFPATGGAIVDASCPECGRTSSFWFTSGGGGTFTSPPADFSTLIQNGNGTYTRTLANGTKINFNSTGYETSVVDLNGLTTTYAYNGSNQLATITDPYSKVTTFTYVSNELATIKDPSNRVTTFTHTGAYLTGVTLPDSGAWSYAYDGSGRLTKATDPLTHALTVTYDSGGRASGTSRPDATTESITPYERQGWVPAGSGTSGSPYAPVLLAQAVASYTDPVGNVTRLRPDWYGLGETGQQVDPYGNVATNDLNTNGLATVGIDPLSRISQYAYDTHGNVLTLTNPDLTTQTFTYNSYAEVLTATNENAHTTSYTYDVHGNNTVVKDALTKLTTMTYTSDGKLATVKDANLNVTSYQYDAQDRLTTITYPGAATTLYGYDAQGDVNSVTDENSHTTTSSYDAMDRQTGTTDALTNRTTYVYDTAGDLTVVHAPLSRTTTYAYDAMERLTTLTDPLGNNTVYGYNGDGSITTVKDPLGRVTTTAYDALNRPTQVTDPRSGTTTTVYDADGEVLNTIDPLSRTTTYTYTNRGQVATYTDPMGNVVTYTYNPVGNPSSMAGGLMIVGNQATSITYDADERLISVTDHLTRVTSTVYDPVGNVSATVDGAGDATTYTYDGRNRLIAVTDPLSHVTSYGLDNAGNRTTVTDPLSHVTTTAYDALNHATTITNPTGTTTIAYDAAGRETSLTDPKGNTTTWAYDANDRVTTETTPLGTTTYAYDADGELTDATDRNGRRVTYSYDGDRNRTGETWVGASPSETVTYTYDADNELTNVKDAFATLTFTYDGNGQQLSAATSGPATNQPSVTLSSTYDSQNNRITLSDNLSSAGVTTYSYDSMHQMTTILTNLGSMPGSRAMFAYDQAGRMTSIARQTPTTRPGIFTSSASTTITYDAASRVTSIVDGVPGGSTVDSQSYAYDSANRVTSETNAEGTATFTYDNSNELTGVGGSRHETYTYDANGNRTMTGYATGSANELTASPGYTYSYDNQGNMTAETQTSTGDVTTFTYDYRNRLVGAVEQNSSHAVVMQATYVYDALDHRIETDETVSGTETKTWTVYDGVNAYADFSGSGVLQQRYLYGPAVHEILARVSAGGTVSWYLADKLGSVTDIVNTSGAVLDHIAYDSYGNVTSQSNASNGDRFQFAGMQSDSATGLNYDQARWYSATTGRFSTEDPIEFGGLDSNLYRYTRNDSINYLDNTGFLEEPAQEPGKGQPKGKQDPIREIPPLPDPEPVPDPNPKPRPTGPVKPPVVVILGPGAPLPPAPPKGTPPPIVVIVPGPKGSCTMSSGPIEVTLPTGTIIGLGPGGVDVGFPILNPIKIHIPRECITRPINMVPPYGPVSTTPN
jgi:RHS repeat-associated protein